MTKLFVIIRETDNTGISGIGIVADGVQFKNGKCVLCWRGKIQTIVIHENIKSVMQLSCSHSKSKIKWLN